MRRLLEKSVDRFLQQSLRNGTLKSLQNIQIKVLQDIEETKIFGYLIFWGIPEEWRIYWRNPWKKFWDPLQKMEKCCLKILRNRFWNNFCTSKFGWRSGRNFKKNLLGIFERQSLIKNLSESQNIWSNTHRKQWRNSINDLWKNETSTAA